MNRQESDRHFGETNRQANARLDTTKLHSYWEQYGSNGHTPDDPRWKRLHTRVTNQWRRSGEEQPNVSTPQGFDSLVRRIGAMNGNSPEAVQVRGRIVRGKKST